MKNAILKWIPLLVLLVPMQARAVPITYDIVFTASGGNAPTAAEFTYDADTLTMTSLSITWEGITFDNFTFSRNDGICGLGDVAAFDLLMRACPGEISYYWGGSDVPFGWYFEIVGFVWETEAQLRLASNVIDSNCAGQCGGLFGGFGTTWDVIPRATAVPEPGTLALLGLGLAGLGFTRRRRKTMQV